MKESTRLEYLGDDTQLQTHVDAYITTGVYQTLVKYCTDLFSAKLVIILHLTSITVDE